MMILRIARYLVLAACLLASGCGGELESQVAGIVTLDGARLEGGTIAFHPVEAGTTAYGSIDPRGEYKLKTGQGEGMAPGEYIVVVQLTEAVETPADPAAPERPPQLLTPRRYAMKQTSPLRYTVVPGEQTIDIPLESE